MISLTYLSTATLPLGPDELRELLVTTRESNHGAGLSGMLLHVDGHFIQTLEGPEDAVAATFARIERDTRHRSVQVVLREEIDSRTFPDWSMGFEEISEEEAAELPGFNDYLAGEPLTEESRLQLGRPGIFHRLFRDRSR